MNPVEWLSARAPGFSGLSHEERDAIMHFSLLWSFFESEVLNTQASAASILRVAQSWERSGRLAAAAFDASLRYFRARYFQNGKATEHFADLHLRGNDNQPLVEAVLSGKATSPAENAAAVLIVVYRFRNNLFHGVKWAYGIRDQIGNFTHANAALMRAIELHDHV